MVVVVNRDVSHVGFLYVNLGVCIVFMQGNMAANDVTLTLEMEEESDFINILQTLQEKQEKLMYSVIFKGNNFN